MPLISCKFELNLKWTNECILSAAGADNNASSNNIIFTIKDAKLFLKIFIWACSLIKHSITRSLNMVSK